MNDWIDVAWVLLAVLAVWLVLRAIAAVAVWRLIRRRMREFDAERAETDAWIEETRASIRRGARRSPNRFRL